MSTTALINASRASANDDDSDLSTAVTHNNTASIDNVTAWTVVSAQTDTTATVHAAHRSETKWRHTVQRDVGVLSAHLLLTAATGSADSTTQTVLSAVFQVNFDLADHPLTWRDTRKLAVI